MGRSNTEADFWARVAIDGDNNCWEWYGALDIGGYGRFKMGGVEDKAHRWSFRLIKGDIPGGLIVRHSCDNRACVNPQHLELGTHKDNSRDRSERTFHFKGETNPNAVLTDAQRAQIKLQYGTYKTTQKKLAEHYGVSKAAIWYVLNDGKLQAANASL